MPRPAERKLHIGMDMVQISRIRQSVDQFGERFATRLFTANEISDSMESRSIDAARLAERFAAKEAAIKAFDLSEFGFDWRDLEVVKQADGSHRLAMHRRLAEMVGLELPGNVLVTLSHGGDYATAVVVTSIYSSTCKH